MELIKTGLSLIFGRNCKTKLKEILRHWKYIYLWFLKTKNLRNPRNIIDNEFRNLRILPSQKVLKCGSILYLRQNTKEIILRTFNSVKNSIKCKGIK